MLNKAQANEEKKARAFSEWFVIAANGGKMSYLEYLELAGLIEEEKVSDSEYKAAAMAAVKMHQAMSRKK